RSVVKASRRWSDRRRFASTLPATLRSQGSGSAGTASSFRQAIRNVSLTTSLATSGDDRLAAYAYTRTACSSNMASKRAARSLSRTPLPDGVTELMSRVGRIFHRVGELGRRLPRDD